MVCAGDAQTQTRKLLVSVADSVVYRVILGHFVTFFLSAAYSLITDGGQKVLLERTLNSLRHTQTHGLTLHLDGNDTNR